MKTARDPAKTMPKLELDIDRGQWLLCDGSSAEKITVHEAICRSRNRQQTIDRTREAIADLNERIVTLERKDRALHGPLTDDERFQLTKLEAAAERLDDEFSDWHNDLLTAERINWTLWLYAGGDLEELKQSAALAGDWELVERINRYRKRHDLL